jgi:hypothetical protein
VPERQRAPTSLSLQRWSVLEGADRAPNPLFPEVSNLNNISCGDQFSSPSLEAAHSAPVWRKLHVLQKASGKFRVRNAREMRNEWYNDIQWRTQKQHYVCDVHQICLGTSVDKKPYFATRLVG